MAVDRSKFRTCSQTSFCRRHRETPPDLSQQYKVEPSSVRFIFPSENEENSNEVEQSSKDNEKSNSWSSMFFKKESKSQRKEYLGPAPVLKALLKSMDSSEALQLNIHLQENGVARIRITETEEFIQSLENLQKKEPRWTSDELVLKEDGMIIAEDVQFIPVSKENLTDKMLKPYIQRLPKQDGNFMGLKYNSYVILVRIDTFEIHMLEDMGIASKDPPMVSINTDNLMYFEQRQSYKGSEQRKTNDIIHTDNVQRNAEELEKRANQNEKEIVGYWEDGKAIYSDGSREDDDITDSSKNAHRREQHAHDEIGLWDEKFQSHHDSKPYGPMSVGLDITFPQSHHLFGIPEHASETLLQKTVGEDAHYKEPYRLYNLDVFEYELDETMALYGSIPFIISHRITQTDDDPRSSSIGVFYFNPTETFIDVFDKPSSASHGRGTHWMSESGILDIFLLPGSENPSQIYKQYATLTGYPYLPPSFALGYHQCRWNYRDENDALTVHANFEKYDYPYDVLWLDIEHTDEKRYFTWDKHQFPNPISMQQKIEAQGRKMVTIVDPHIKRDNGYYVHKQASYQKLYIRDKDGNDFDGWCWPGSSSYPDFTSTKVREWWALQFLYENYEGSTPSLYTWNDMNEPSVFNGPEVSMQKDCLNLDEVEHREWHNLYGMTFHRATAEGLILRNANITPTRPFVLSRSFFAGSQQYGPIWTGDNTAEWSHLAIAAPMLLSLNIAGLPFVGADVGGFFGNPDEQLMIRWNQAGAYQPFFRGHAHHDSKRREPWVFGEQVLQILRKAAMARYALIPYWYTVFWSASVTGMPIMRPMWMEFPVNSDVLHLDDQYMIGSDLLVKPITAPDQSTAEVTFPSSSYWYDVDTMDRISAVNNEATVTLTVDAPLDKIPVYQRGGSIIPRKVRLRRSVPLMYPDPYTLYIALNMNQKASGKLYSDDENTFSYEKGDFIISSFSADFNTNKTFTNEITRGESEGMEWIKNENVGMIERIVIMGLEQEPSKIEVRGEELVYDYNPEKMVLVIRKPNVSALHDWKMSYSFE